MATIRDVAKKAGVSIATVSNYLNNSKPVSSQTANRIKQAVDELQYAQNAVAKNLRSQVYRDVGIVLPNFNDPYYVQIFQGIQNAFLNSSYFVNVAFSDDVPELEQKNVKSLLGKQICGLILVSCQPDAWKYYYNNFTAKGKPLVMIDRQINALDANFVSLNNYAVVRDIAAKLLADGRRDLVLFSGPQEFTCENDCIRGFSDAFAGANLELPPSALVQTSITKESAFSKTIRLLKSRHPQVIIASSSLIATGVIEGLHLLGKTVEEIPVITLGEEHWNKFTQSFASYSTSRPAIRVGDTAASLLLEQLVSPLRDTERVVLKDITSRFGGFTTGLLSRHAPSLALQTRHPLRILMLDNPVVHTFQGLVKSFEAEMGIPVDIHLLPHHSISREIQTASQNYDVLMFDLPWVANLASRNLLLDITGRLAQMDTSMFFQDALQQYVGFRGNYYGVPFLYAPQMLYYRKDLFDDPVLRADFERQFGGVLHPPLTLKEYNAVAEFFTTGTDAVAYGMSLAAAYTECFAPEIHFRLHAYGSRLYDAAGNVTFDNPQTLKAYINLIRALKFAKPDYLQSTDVSIIDNFLKGDTAMLITYPAFLSEAADLRKCSTSIGYSLVPGRTPLLGGWSLGISRSTDQPDAAFEFLRWSCDEKISSYFTIMGGQTAVVSAYTNDEMVKLYPWLPLYYKAYSYTQRQTLPVLSNGQIVPSEQVDSTLCHWAYEILLNHLDIQEAISRTQQELEVLFQSFLHSTEP